MATKAATAEKAAPTVFHAEGFLASLDFQIAAMLKKYWPDNTDMTPVILKIAKFRELFRTGSSGMRCREEKKGKR